MSEEDVPLTPRNNQSGESTPGLVPPPGGGTGNDSSLAWRRRKEMLLADAHSHTLAGSSSSNSRIPAYSSETGASRQVDPGGLGTPNVGPSHNIRLVRWDLPSVRSDVVRLIEQWLQENGFGATRSMLIEEAGIKEREREEMRGDARKLRTAILEGDWPEVDKLCGKPLVKDRKAFLYAVYKQQFLEYIEHREYQKAFTYLQKRLKPLEHYQAIAYEFHQLCYLLTAKSVTDAPAFRTWEGIQPAREKLVEQFAEVLEQVKAEDEGAVPSASAMLEGSGGAQGGAALTSRQDKTNGSSSILDVGSSSLQSEGGAASNAPPNSDSTITKSSGYVYVPPHRLATLISQAVAYQVEFARYHPKRAPVVNSLLHDYRGLIVPNTVSATLRGHRRNVKSVAFVGEEGRRLVSGSSDHTVRLWSTESVKPLPAHSFSATSVVPPQPAAPNRCEAVLEGHASRVWQVTSTRTGGMVASASGDSTVRVWDVANRTCAATLRGGQGDAYTCCFHPNETHLVAAGYDKVVRYFDLTTNTVVKTFTGHQLGVSSAVFNPSGNLIVTASKDATLRCWDLVSGLAITTLTAHLGEVTSVAINEAGTHLLSGSKDNSCRLWDLRMLRPLQRFTGHTNTPRSNFVRASFGVSASLVVGGSEDGLIYIWDVDSGETLQVLQGHEGVVYDAVWNRHQSLLASCGDDGTVRTWVWDEAAEA